MLQLCLVRALVTACCSSVTELMHLDRNDDPRPAWDVELRCRTSMRWDHLDRARFATELQATGGARRVSVLDDCGSGVCRVSLRLQADDESHAVLFAIAAIAVAARSLGVVVDDMLGVRLRLARPRQADR